MTIEDLFKGTVDDKLNSEELVDTADELVRITNNLLTPEVKSELIKQIFGYFTFFSACGSGFALIANNTSFFAENTPDYLRTTLYTLGALCFGLGLYFAGSIYKSMKGLDS